MKPNRVTIVDIARTLKVSPSTVSRALQDSHEIGDATKLAVKELARQLNYRPNLVARRLTKQRSMTVGVVMPEISYYFNSQALRGIEDVLQEKGFNLLICQTHESYQREVFHFENLLANQADGIISSVSGEPERVDHYYKAQQQGVPVVLFDRGCNVPGVSKVMIDNVEAGRMATEHLIAAGCRRIAFLQGPEGLSLTHARKRGYVEALQAAGLPFDPQLVKAFSFGSDMGHSQALSLLQGPRPPDGFFAINDRIAIGVYAALRDQGLRVPEDVAVIGFNDEPYAAFLHPTLTSVAQPAFKMGQEAARMFLRRLEHPNGGIENKVFGTRLEVRDSTRR